MNRLDLIVSGLLQILEGIVIVLTLAFIQPQWAGDYLEHRKGEDNERS